jgi:hypothetical protein
MQNVPKIVRERLKAATPAVNHPDADALTAFAEHSLLALERDVVLEHLARCGDCRDIVALALPATEPVQTVVSTSSGWLTWPALRWAFVAAGIIAMASFGILQYQKSMHASMVADRAFAPQAASTEAKNQPLPLPAAPVPVGKGDKITAPPAPAFADSGATNLMVMQNPAENADKKKSMSRAEAVPAPAVSLLAGRASGASPDGRSLGGPITFGPRVANQFQQQNFQQQNIAQNQAPAPPPTAFGKQQAAGNASANMRTSADTQTIEVSGAAPQVAQAQTLDSTLAQDQPAAQPPSSENYAYDKLSRAKLPVPPGQIGGYVVDPSGAVVPNARITLIPSGTGQRSTAVTNSQGLWLIAGVPTGSYKAQAEAPGFKPTVLALNYDANQPSMYSFTLNVGSVAETVAVAAQSGQVQSEQVQTDGAAIAGSISDREVSQTAMNGRNVTQLVAVSPGALSLWAITSTGALRRSFDQGKTWQDVDVNANPASITSASLAVASDTPRTKAKDSNKALKQQSATLTFHAVAAAGAEVWAGGSGAALYHSADAGNHWTRVVPAASGTVLTGDITSVEFPDPQHGKVATSTAEVWTTTDNGQTWQKQ